MLTKQTAAHPRRRSNIKELIGSRRPSRAKVFIGAT